MIGSGQTKYKVNIYEVISSTNLRRYIATVRVAEDGDVSTLTTSTKAESREAAWKLLVSIYGRAAVVDVREILDEGGAELPLSSDKLKVQSLQRKKDAADSALTAERNRQKVARAEQALQRAKQAQAKPIRSRAKVAS